MAGFKAEVIRILIAVRNFEHVNSWKNQWRGTWLPCSRPTIFRKQKYCLVVIIDYYNHNSMAVLGTIYYSQKYHFRLHQTKTSTMQQGRH